LNIFSSINEGLKTVHKNYQILFIHFAFLFVAFFSLFFILSIPLGVLFVIFGIDLTDILKGSFIEIIISSINLLKKFLIISVVFLLSLVIYIIFVISLWIYIFSGTLGIVYQYLERGIIFNLKDFHHYGKKFFWKIGAYSIFSALLFFIFTFIIGLISDLSSSFIELLRQYSHSVYIFFSVFFYLTILISAIISFIIWISFTFIGYYGIVAKNFTALKAIKETRKYILLNPNSFLRAFLLFTIYVLTGGIILSIGSMLTIIPTVGTLLAAVYQFVTQFAHIYITMVIFTAYFAYYLRTVDFSQEASQSSDSYQEVSQPEQVPPEEVHPQKSQNQST